MSYKTFVSMNIAVIGSGAVAESYAVRFASEGHEIYMACKEGDKTGIRQGLTVLDNIHITSIEAAAEVGDLIIIATDPADVREVSYWLGDVRRKVIIDATCNIDVPGEDPVKTACAIRAITGSAHIVKIFHTTGYEHVLKPFFRQERVELILAGDSRKAKEIAKIIMRELGICHCYDFGGEETLPFLNELARSLRKLDAVTATTAPTLIARY